MEISEYKEFAEKVVKNYRTDLDHDLRFFESKTPSIVFLRENGSHMISLDPFDMYPKCFERIKYLFGTADRWHILRDKVSTVEWCIKNDNSKVVVYFNGKDLKVISHEKSRNIISKYYDLISDRFNKSAKI